VITDYQLDGGEDGLSFARRFNAAYPGIPIILVTAYASDHLIQTAAAMPDVTVLRKPLQYEDLHDVLHRKSATGPES
jgi:CheY-like chemotaxis protein